MATEVSACCLKEGNKSAHSNISLQANLSVPGKRCGPFHRQTSLPRPLMTPGRALKDLKVFKDAMRQICNR